VGDVSLRGTEATNDHGLVLNNEVLDASDIEPTLKRCIDRLVVMSMFVYQ
jgi:hypothetical protein